MSFSNWMEHTILNHVFGKAVYNPQTIFVGLCTANPGDGATGGSCSEVGNSNGYARVQTAPGDWNWPVGGEVWNASEIIFPRSTGSWGTVTHFVLVNSGTYGAGNVLVYGGLSIPRTVSQWSVPRMVGHSLYVHLD